MARPIETLGLFLSRFGTDREERSARLRKGWFYTTWADASTESSAPLASAYNSRMSQRNAVSVLVTASSDERQVLLVERNPKLKFFGGFFAFPGGKVDADDGNVPVDHLESTSETPPAMWVAAARELFEETGLWLGRGSRAASPEALARARKDLLAEETRFDEILRTFGHRLDARLLEPLGRMTTPPFSPLRYDTWFFHHRSDALSSVDIWPGELVSSRTLEAGEADEAWKRGQLRLAPPMVILLREWEKGPVAAKKSDPFSVPALPRRRAPPNLLFPRCAACPTQDAH